MTNNGQIKQRHCIVVHRYVEAVELHKHLTATTGGNDRWASHFGGCTPVHTLLKARVRTGS